MVRPPLLRRTISRLEEDMRAAQLLVRDQAPMADVDWNAIDWSKVDYSGVDWSTVNFAQPPATATNTPIQTTSTQSLSTPLPQPPAPSAPPIVQQPPAPAPSASDAPSVAVNTGAALGPAPDYFKGIDASQVAIAISWHGNAPQTFNFYGDVAAFQPQFGDAYKSITLQPGTYQTVTLPNNFSGRVQKMTGHVDEPATWAEVTFSGWKDLTFFDVSYIRGNNGAMVMKMADNSAIAGTQEDLMSEAPADTKGVSSTGQPYLKATEGFDGSLTLDLVEFYRDKIPTSLGYVRNFDDTATKASPCKQMIINAW